MRLTCEILRLFTRNSLLAGDFLCVRILQLSFILKCILKSIVDLVYEILLMVGIIFL